MSFFTIRLKEARLKAGLSQEQLGIGAGLDEMSASTRMNRYELGKRVPNTALVRRLALVLNVPLSYFYALDEMEAQLLISYHRLDEDKKHHVVEFIIELA